jgi:molybdenum cofactor cytidylyltransferase
MSKVAALILAAGQASRFRAAAGPQGPVTKLVAQLDGKALVRHVTEAALASQARPVVLVTGYASEAVTQAVQGLPVIFTHNARHADGLSTSLQAGLAALPGDVDGALVLLGDMPRISAGLIDRLIEAFRASPHARAIVPLTDGRRGNPVLISRALFPEVASISGDVGARPLLQAAGTDVVEVRVEDAAIAFDVDTPDGLTG